MIVVDLLLLLLLLLFVAIKFGAVQWWKKPQLGAGTRSSLEETTSWSRSCSAGSELLSEKKAVNEQPMGLQWRGGRKLQLLYVLWWRG